MKLLRNTKNKIRKDENGEKFPHSKITEIVLVHYNIVNNDYQYDSSVLYTFVPNKLFNDSLDISPKKKKSFLKTFNSDFSYIEVWFTDKISKLLEIEDKINITSVIT